MKAALALLWVLTVAAAFALGGLRASERAPQGSAGVASLQDAFAARDDLERAHRMTAFLRGLGPAELPAALEALESHHTGMTTEEVRFFMLAWSKFDAPGAFAWARARPTAWTDTLMAEAMYAWGLRDPRAALRELEAMEASEELQARLRLSLLEGWLHGPDRVGASEYIADISDPRRRRRLASVLAHETMREGPEAVLRWAEAVPEDAPNDFKRGAFYFASTVVAREDPRRAARWFEAHRTPRYSAGSLDGIARGWAEYHDPPALFAWLGSLPSDGERGSEPGKAIAVGFRVWLRKAPEAAKAWLASKLPDPELDPAVAEVVRASSQTSPAEAVEWAGRIQDETERRRRMIMAAGIWQRKDPEAVRAWLARSDVPEEVRQSIPSGPAATVRRPAARPGATPAPR